jgi:hypothetical protein
MRAGGSSNDIRVTKICVEQSVRQGYNRPVGCEGNSVAYFHLYF